MVTHSADETVSAGRSFASRLTAGDLVLLEGPLGSGKTTFVQGLAEGLGAQGLATSPSFVIVHEYPVPNPRPQTPGPSVLRHIDLYRLSDPTVDVDRIGLPELLRDQQAITVVEWADRIPAVALREGGQTSRRIVRVQFDYGENETSRVIHVSGL